MQATKREPKIVMGMRKRSAQESAAKYRKVHEDRLRGARERLDAAESRLREDREIRVDVADAEVHRGQMVLTTRDLMLRTGTPVDLDLRGPERLAVTGPNGSGKTTLLHTLAGRLDPRAGEVVAHVPIALLPQRLDVLDDGLSVFGQCRPAGTRRRPQRGQGAAGPVPVPGSGGRPGGRCAIRR